jgi:uncharacterized protein YycO
MNKIKSIALKIAKPFIQLLDGAQLRWKPMFFSLGPTSYKVKGHNQREIMSNILPGDIILTKNDHYVTSMLIPGHYSHIGIYVGANKVIHSVNNKGVIKEDILDFLRVDEAVALRLVGITKEERIEVCVRAHRELGKEYDYQFNFYSTSRFSCIELVHKCFEDMKTGLEIRTNGFYKGRILPDDVLRTAFKVFYRSR